MKQVLKFSFAAVIATLAFLGVNFSSQKVAIAGNLASVTLLSLGTEAQAYCNEATYWPETNNGSCTGAANDANSRCKADGTGTLNCTTR